MSENEADRKAAEELVRDLWAANKDTHYERVLIAAAFRAQARREGRREGFWAGFDEGINYSEPTQERHEQAKKALYKFENRPPPEKEAEA